MGYKYSCDERLFLPDKLSPGRAYILGVIWADGYLGQQGFRITSSDVDWLRSLPEIGEFSASIYARKESAAADLVVNNKAIIQVIAHYGLHNRKSITGSPSNIPAPTLHHFMRGVFDGDGSVWSQKTQIRVFIAGSEQSTGWFKMVIPSGDGFFIARRNGDAGEISGRLIANNQHCRVLQSRNSSAAELFLRWIYGNSDGARLERKYQRFADYIQRKAAYHSMTCPVCSEPFSRRSSTDEYCQSCARVRLRLCNRRADHMRRNPESASEDINDYRKESELHLKFPARLYGSRSRKNQKLLDSVKKAVEEMQA